MFALADRIDVPIVVMMAGGYGTDIEQTCAIHAETVAQAAMHAERRSANVA